MTWSEFATLLSGLMPDTPLGQIISIRAEKDKEIIKRFTKDRQKEYKVIGKEDNLRMLTKKVMKMQ